MSLQPVIPTLSAIMEEAAKVPSLVLEPCVSFEHILSEVIVAHSLIFRFVGPSKAANPWCIDCGALHCFALLCVALLRLSCFSLPRFAVHIFASCFALLCFGWHCFPLASVALPCSLSYHFAQSASVWFGVCCFACFALLCCAVICGSLLSSEDSPGRFLENRPGYVGNPVSLRSLLSLRSVVDHLIIKRR